MSEHLLYVMLTVCKPMSAHGSSQCHQVTAADAY